MTAIYAGSIFAMAFLVGYKWMRRAFERTAVKDTQYVEYIKRLEQLTNEKERQDFISDIRRRADYSQQNGSDEFSVTIGEYMKLLQFDDLTWILPHPSDKTRIGYASLFGCKVKILPEPIAPSRPGYMEAHHV